MKHTVVREDETLDYIINTYYKSSFGYLELVLAANNFLYSSDLYLKIGTVIELPSIPVQYKERINLW